MDNFQKDFKEEKLEEEVWTWSPGKILAWVAVIIAAVIIALIWWMNSNLIAEPLPPVNTNNNTNNVVNTNETPEPPIEEEIVWQTYEDTYLGISFDYPKGFIIDPKTKKTRFVRDQESGDSIFIITVSENIENIYGYTTEELQNMELIEMSHIIEIPDKDEDVIFSDIFIDGNLAKRFSIVDDEHYGNTGVYLFIEDKIIFFRGDDQSETSENYFEKFLESFQFIDQTDEWQTYSNQEWGFSFKYPNDWVYLNEMPAGTEPNYVGYSVTVGEPGYNGVGMPSLYVGINPDGYGPFFYDKTIILKKNSSSLSIIEENEVERTEYHDDNIYFISALTDQYDNESDRYSFQFQFRAGDNDESDLVIESILNSFRFTD